MLKSVWQQLGMCNGGHGSSSSAQDPPRPAHRLQVQHDHPAPEGTAGVCPSTGPRARTLTTSPAPRPSRHSIGGRAGADFRASLADKGARRGFRRLAIIDVEAYNLSVTQEQVRRCLAEARSELGALGVRSLDLFGSVARGEASPDSDVDLLVEFDRPIGLFHFFRVQRRLEEILDARVDLVMRDAVKPQLRDRILAEAIRAT
jgi:predicted nucleotidyltransferase